MECYWAEIQQGDNAEIVFYTESELARKGLLLKVRALRDDLRRHQRSVRLRRPDIDRLTQAGVTVLMPDFFALEGRWHWFTGCMRMDAFSLSPEFETTLRQKGSIVVRL